MRALLRAVHNEYLFWALLGGLLAMSVLRPEAIGRYPSLVDWPTLAALTGLLVLTTGIEASGYLGGLAGRIVKCVHNERQLAIALSLAAALLGSVLTNDIALFIMVPLTLSLGRHADLSIARLAIFEAMAANAGSALTPIGNPQNLFLWHVSGTSFLTFVGVMAPLVAMLMGVLLVFLVACFRASPLQPTRGGSSPRLDRRLLAVSLALYLPFIVCLEMRWWAPGVVGVLGLFAAAYRRVLAKVDWVLLVLFILMFVDLRLVAEFPAVRMFFEHIGLARADRLFLVGVGSSQVMSNVPAAILLTEFTTDWRTLAYAVNVGGFGLVLGSLANIIALRLAAAPGIWWRFHLYSVPFLLAAGGLAYAGLYLP